jgi:ABC-type multidrug transport system ATPase subunit
MILLSLERVGKRYPRGMGERTTLREVSLEVDSGEYVVVWGLRGSGRSTLLRIAAGIETPDEGVVRFAGRDLADHGIEILGEGIGYCQQTHPPGQGLRVVEQLTVTLLARGIAPARARTRAHAALERTEIAHCATLTTEELDSGDAVRVALARTLVAEPQLVVVDEPTSGVELADRDGILRLLRSLADEGIAVLASTGEATGLSGADRTLVLGDGQLRGSLVPKLAPVVALREAAGGRAGG